jgi:hypothetical protein
VARGDEQRAAEQDGGNSPHADTSSFGSRGPIAALSGMTIKEYVLERVLPPVPEPEDLSEEDALRQLEAVLKPRIAAARRGEVVPVSVEQIFADVRREPKP